MAGLVRLLLRTWAASCESSAPCTIRSTRSCRDSLSPALMVARMPPRSCWCCLRLACASCKSAILRRLAILRRWSDVTSYRHRLPRLVQTSHGAPPVHWRFVSFHDHRRRCRRRWRWLTRVLRCLQAPHAVDILRLVSMADNDADGGCTSILLSDGRSGMV